LKIKHIPSYWAAPAIVPALPKPYNVSHPEK
jgi:hypothetical protein